MKNYLTICANVLYLLLMESPINKFAPPFNSKKAIEAILYLANRISNHDKYGICKLLYFADKLSLENYGRFIYGESYCAMEDGATPSKAYDLIKRKQKDFKLDKHLIVPSRDADIKYFSKSDLKCLDKIIELFGDKGWRERYDAAHDEAYHEAWNRRGTSGRVDMPVESIAQRLSNGDALVNYLVNCGAD